MHVLQIFPFEGLNLIPQRGQRIVVILSLDFDDSIIDLSRILD
jgi:hypothetical protein